MQNLTIIDYLQIILRNKRLIAWSVGVTFLITPVICFLLPKQYKSSATLMSTSGQQSSLNSLMGQFGSIPALSQITSSIMGGGGERLLNILNSRSVGVDAAKALKLEKLIFASDWNEETQSWKNPEEAPTALHAYYKMVDEGWLVIDKEDTGLFKVTVYFNDPFMASKIANEHVAAAERFINNNTFSLAKKNRVFLEQQLKETAVRLAEAETDLKVFQEQNKLVALDAQMSLTIEAIAEIKSKILNIDLQLAMLKQTSSGNNPQSRLLLGQKKELLNQLEQLEEKEKLTQSNDTQQESTNNKAQEEHLFMKLGNIPEKGLEFLRLKRAGLIQEKIYELLTQQYEIAKIEEIKEEVALTIIDPAIPNMGVVFPKPALFTLIAMFLAFLVSVAYAFLKEYLKNNASKIEVLKAG